MKKRFIFRLKEPTISVGLTVAYVCCLSQFGVAAQSGKMLLEKVTGPQKLSQRKLEYPSNFQLTSELSFAVIFGLLHTGAAQGQGRAERARKPKEPYVEEEGRSKYFFWSGNGTTRALIRGATRTLARVFEISGVVGAHAHRFRHTLATALLEKGWTAEDVSDVLGSTPEIIRKHYAQWTAKRQERILSLAQDVWSGKFLASSKKVAVPVESERR